MISPGFPNHITHEVSYAATVNIWKRPIVLGIATGLWGTEYLLSHFALQTGSGHYLLGLHHFSTHIPLLPGCAERQNQDLRKGGLVVLLQTLHASLGLLATGWEFAFFVLVQPAASSAPHPDGHGRHSV